MLHPFKGGEPSLLTATRLIEQPEASAISPATAMNLKTFFKRSHLVYYAVQPLLQAGWSDR
jgi:hypothetical protein